jgi:hypothetical protein
MDNESNERKPLGIIEFQTKLAALEQAQNAAKEQVNSIFRGETFFFKTIQWFGTAVLALLALGGIFNYVVNTTKLNDSVAVADQKINNAIESFKTKQDLNEMKLQWLSDNIKQRLDEISGKTEISSAIVTSLRNGSDVLKPNFFFAPEWTGPILTYKESFRFDVKVSVSGPGIADFRGFIVRSDSELIKILAQYYYGTNEAYIESLHNGTTIYIEPRDIIAGAPLETGFDLSRTLRTCNDAENDFEQLSNVKDMGDIDIEPVIANSEGRLPAKRFHIVIGNDMTMYSCMEFTKRMGKV